VFLFSASIAGIAWKDTRPIPLTSEIIYAVITIIAALSLVSRVVLPAFTSGQNSSVGKQGVRVTFLGKLWLLWASFGILFGVAGIPMDKHVCTYLLGKSYWTEFNAVHILFLGCDIGFHGLLMYCLFGVKTTISVEKKRS
jgi:hypothetical protein